MLWSSQTQSARMSIMFITAGTLLDVWTAVYYFLIHRPKVEQNPSAGVDSSLFWIAGFFLTGLTLLVIGVLVGQIGRAAGKAEVAPVATVPTLDTLANVGAVANVPAFTPDLRQPVAAATVQGVSPVAR